MLKSHRLNYSWRIIQSLRCDMSGILSWQKEGSRYSSPVCSDLLCSRSPHEEGLGEELLKLSSHQRLCP